MSLSDELFRLMTKVSDQTIYQSLLNYEFFEYDTDWRSFQINAGGRDLTKRELIHKFMEERWAKLAEDLKYAVADVDGRLFIHRCIMVKDTNAFIDSLSKGKLPRPYKGLGVYWTWDYGEAQCYWGDSEHGEKIILSGTIDLSGIDLKGTVLANFHPEVDEMEIKVKKGAKIRLTDLSLDDVTPLKRFHPEPEFPA